MPDLLKANGAEIRTADTLLRTCGGRAVLLRLPAPGIPGDATEQLGLATPEFQEVELAPVVVRSATTKGTREVLISATTINALVGSLGYSAANILFETAYGLLLDGVLLEVISLVENETRGIPYLYRITLRVPAKLAT